MGEEVQDFFEVGRVPIRRKVNEARSPRKNFVEIFEEIRVGELERKIISWFRKNVGGKAFENMGERSFDINVFITIDVDIEIDVVVVRGIWVSNGNYWGDDFFGLEIGHCFLFELKLPSTI
ncbi:hypothetical protein ASC97_32430 [Rhizobium sp. Root1203]|nr:hypothetical protein ASC97_32430 [Rhizobium sp. Root1203]